jgi:hypothetical protein
MNPIWGSLVWRCLPENAKAGLGYLEELSTNLFVSLPLSTKRTFVNHAQGALHYPTFVETGTYLGDMSSYASCLFSRVHTIELSVELAKRAADRLAGVPNVTVHQGDSGRVLRDLLPIIDTPCVFWLDGHFSGGITARGETDTPILAELEAIAHHAVRPHAIFIDDARVFGTDDMYPTLEEVFRYLRQIDPAFRIGVSSDIIWASPVRILHFEWHRLPSGMVVAPTTATGVGAVPSPQMHRSRASQTRPPIVNRPSHLRRILGKRARGAPP